MSPAEVRAYVARLGAEKAASRLGVSARTLRRWMRDGIPASREAAGGTIRRSASSARAAVTRARNRETVIEGAKRTPRTPRPRDPVRPENAAPTRMPRPEEYNRDSTTKWRGFRDRVKKRARRGRTPIEPYETPNKDGEQRTYIIDELYHLWDARAFVDEVIKDWRKTRRRWCQLVFVFMRWISPDSPSLDGSLSNEDDEDREGKWVPTHRWARQAEKSREGDLHTFVRDAFAGVDPAGITGEISPGRYPIRRSIDEWAESRYMLVSFAVGYFWDRRAPARSTLREGMRATYRSAGEDEYDEYDEED